MKKRILYCLFYLGSIGAVFLLCFKFNNQINACKVAVLSVIRENQEPALSDFEDLPAFPHTGEEWYADNLLVCHAGGGIEGLDYTNSREALENTLANGCRYVEIDFSYTSDHELVCMHAWDEAWGEPGSEEIPALQDFLAGKIYGKYTPMTAMDIVDYMRNEPDLHIIVDTKETDFLGVIENLKELASEDASVMDRFIIQLYDSGMKAKVQDIYPFPDENILFTAYMFGTDRVGSILKLCYEEDISVVTTKYDSWDDETVRFFNSKGIVIFEHTVNRPDFANRSLARGIHGFYTDFLTMEDLHIDP